MVQPVHIVAYKRTPIGSYCGSLSKIKATELAALAIKEALNAVNLPPQTVDYLVMGNVYSAGLGQNPAKQAALSAGIPKTVPVLNANKVCASGMVAIQLGRQRIMLDESQIVVVGGFESMSNVPYYDLEVSQFTPYQVLTVKYRQNKAQGKLEDGLTLDGLLDASSKLHMGQCTEKTAEQVSLSRQETDEYCIMTYERAIQSQKEGRFKDELFEVSNVLGDDEELKKYNKNKIPTLRTPFKENGTITAANASKISDGACALGKLTTLTIVLMSADKVKELNLESKAVIIDYVEASSEPINFCMAPQQAIISLLSRQGLKLDDIDFFEINEAFTTTVLANSKTLNIPLTKINVNGGAVALGHPLGMSGARIVASLVTVLHQQKGTYGIAAICNGGGEACAILIKRAEVL